MSNATIGMVRCPLSGELAAVRKDKRGAFYYISIAGRIAPSSDFGQDWFLEHATIWGEGAPPDDCPEWIRQGRSFPPFTRSRGGQYPTARQDSPEGAVSVVKPQGTEETGTDRPAAPSSTPPARRSRNPFMLPSFLGDDDDA